MHVTDRTQVGTLRLRVVCRQEARGQAQDEMESHTEVGWHLCTLLVVAIK